MITVATIVEGRGEERAIPKLILRVAQTHEIYDVRVPKPWVLDRAKFLIPAEFERAVEFQAREAGDGGVLALLDADDDRCPGALVARIRGGYRGHRDFALVVAVREYESIFLVGHEPDPEGPRDAKGRLSRVLGRSYHPTRDQEALSAKLNLERARECRWFRKFERELLGILKP
jgi:hypothetical protein